MAEKKTSLEKLSDQYSLFRNFGVNGKSSETKQTTKYTRPSWDEYFMAMMEAISTRATCDRGRSGCIIIKDHQVLASGYVGSAKGDDHCDDVGHQMQKRFNDDGTVSEHCVRTVHAEQNAICQAAKRGIPIEGATIYVRMTPCAVCAKMLINCGIRRVVCQRKYQRGQDGARLFKKCKIKLEHLSDELQQYGEVKDRK